MEDDMNDWQRMARDIAEIQAVILNNTYDVVQDSDSITMRKDAWISAIVFMQRAQRQCRAYGEMHCPREIPGTPQPEGEGG